MSRGYLTKKKSNGKIYLYLRRSFRAEGIVKHKNLYSFGSLPHALEYLYWLRENPHDFPRELFSKGFSIKDVYDWILTLETKVTPNGRDFEW